MISNKNVLGSKPYTNNVCSSGYIDFNVDTVYIRSNITKMNDSDLYSYEELQMTYKEYEQYKDLLLYKDMTVLKEQIDGMDKRINNTFDVQNNSLEAVQAHYIELSKNNLEKYLENHAITSSCHHNTEQKYSITKEKQTLLAQMIITAKLAIENNAEYQPAWNAAGEKYTFDWTLDELKQLTFEIEAIVRPLILKQQDMEYKIKQAKTKEGVLLVDINF